MNLKKNVIEEIDIVNNIKGLAIDMIEKAGSGHPGIVLSAAPILYTLYAHHININTNDPTWINRDRFVMSAGHGSALLYATLFMSGYDISVDDMKNFRKAGSITPGHPEYGVTPGVDASTGPLGQGLAMAVGMALGGKILENKYVFKKTGYFDKNTKIFDHKVYVLCGDGDLMEGISYEACSFAGAHNLNNLIVLYDSNNISLDGTINHTFKENVCDRFLAMNWNTILVKDGNNINDISKAIEQAKKASKPTFIEIKTIIGSGSLLEGTNEIHGKVMTKNDVDQLKEKLNLGPDTFSYSDFLKQEMIKNITTRSDKKYSEWSSEYNRMKELVPENIDYLFNRESAPLLTKYNFNFQMDYKEELRNTNTEIMNVISNSLPNFIGGSADLASSTKVYLKDKGDVSADNFKADNIWFGIREHAMGAIMNGLALMKFRTYCSTFLAFSDYLKPAIRMSALMGLNPTYIFTHDSVSIGPDGPTHQPIEQLETLRMIPNMYVFRPADANELVGSWNYILNIKNHPNTLVLSRNAVPLLNTTADNILNGGYILKHEEKVLHGIIIATGTEVHTALRVANELKETEGLDIRVVSMPCRELFLEQTNEYKTIVLPHGVRTIVIEAGTGGGWYEFVYNADYLITINNFGISGSPSEVLEHCNFTYEKILERVKKLLK